MISSFVRAFKQLQGEHTGRASRGAPTRFSLGLDARRRRQAPIYSSTGDAHERAARSQRQRTATAHRHTTRHVRAPTTPVHEPRRIAPPVYHPSVPQERRGAHTHAARRAARYCNTRAPATAARRYPLPTHSEAHAWHIAWNGVAHDNESHRPATDRRRMPHRKRYPTSTQPAGVPTNVYNVQRAGGRLEART